MERSARNYFWKISIFLLVIIASVLGITFLIFLLSIPRLQKRPMFAIADSKASLSIRYFTVFNAYKPACLRLELAQTPEHWARGLTFRTALPENSGMLFVFPRNVSIRFNMQNIGIPLSIAFLSRTGVIQEIADMTPGKTLMVNPTSPYRFAIQVNQGWFSQYHITVGNAFKGCVPSS